MTIGSALLELERGHVVRLAIWSACSIGLGLVAILVGRRPQRADAAFWRHAGIQCIAWGLIDLAIAWWASRGLVARDLAGALALDRFLWLNIGLDVGYAMVGVTLIAFGARAPRRAGLIGAGAAIVLQGVVLALLDAQLSAEIVR